MYNVCTNVHNSTVQYVPTCIFNKLLNFQNMNIMEERRPDEISPSVRCRCASKKRLLRARGTRAAVLISGLTNIDWFCWSKQQIMWKIYNNLLIASRRILQNLFLRKFMLKFINGLFFHKKVVFIKNPLLKFLLKYSLVKEIFWKYYNTVLTSISVFRNERISMIVPYSKKRFQIVLEVFL